MQSDVARLDLPFVGIPSFLRAGTYGLDDLDADIAVMGVPTDEGSPFMAGSRFAPRAIREHSLRFVEGKQGYYDPRTRRVCLQHELERSRIADVGDADIVATNAALSFANITAMTTAILERQAFPVVLGGDHAISFPVVRAFSEPLHVFHFDAHLDYARFSHGVEYSNAHAFRHIRQLPQVETLTQVGIRSLRDGPHMMEDSIRDGNTVVTMDEFRNLSLEALVQRVPANARCYVSIDIDVLDISLVPGCVSAEPNGMLYAELRDTLAALTEHAEVVGFDLVEVNPQLDVRTGITSYLAAHLIIEFLGQICEQPRWVRRR